MISPLISPKPLSLVDRLKRLDVHPKTKEDYRVRTVSGGIGESPSTGCDVGAVCSQTDHGVSVLMPKVGTSVLLVDP